MTIGTCDQASLERFTSQLIQASFEPKDKELRVWEGPLSRPMRLLTDASSMRVFIADGWPFRPPKLFVDGLRSEHVNPAGEVCLWQEGDNSLEWMSVEGLNGRIALWVEKTERGFGVEDAALDAHLYFEPREPILATLDLAQMDELQDGQFGKLHGVVVGPRLLRWSDRSQGRDSLAGSWYSRHGLRAPPRNLAEFAGALTPQQMKNFLRLQKRAVQKRVETLALITWPTMHGQNGLGLRLRATEGSSVAAAAVEIARVDKRTLLLRSGPMASDLQNRSIAIFGLGAVGSHVALLCSQCGIGRLRLVDQAVLRPGDIVRHAGTYDDVGELKVHAVQRLIAIKAPATRVEAVEESPWHPERLTRLMQGADLVVDCTGILSFTDHLSIVAQENGYELLSSALYRGGAVGRVRRQLRDDTAICRRADEGSPYPRIPPGPGESELVGLETGCSAPVTNAPPTSVLAVAALTADVAADALAAGGRGFPSEILDVYKALEAPPFDELGRLAI